MISKRIFHIAQLSAVGLAGYYIGQTGKNYNEKNTVVVDGKSWKSMPGLPIFGTVSAATPFTDSGSKDRVKRRSRCMPRYFAVSAWGRVSPASWTGGQFPCLYANVSQIMKYGFPSLDNVRSYDDFVLSYDRRNRVPNWVFEHITKEHIMKNEAVDRSKCDFTPDESIHPFFRSQNSDYKGSGFDRGHMAAAGNHRLSQKHVEQTFFLTNMAPQVGEGFNRHAWNRLEKHVRKLTKVYDNVYCCTGPLYLPRKEPDGKSYIKYQVIGSNTVAVPTHFYKVVVAEAPDGSLDMESYVMPNQKIPDETPVSSYMVPPETIEKAAGLLFFDKLHRSKLNRINGKKI